MSPSNFPLLDLPLVPLKRVLSYVSSYGLFVLYLLNSQLRTIYQFKQNAKIDLHIDFDPNQEWMDIFNNGKELALKIGPFCILIQLKPNGKTVRKVIILCAEKLKVRCPKKEQLMREILSLITEMFRVKNCYIFLHRKMDHLQNSLPAIEAKDVILKNVDVNSDFFREYAEKHKSTKEFHSKRFSGPFYHYEKHNSSIFTCPELVPVSKYDWLRIDKWLFKNRISPMVKLGFAGVDEERGRVTRRPILKNNSWIKFCGDDLETNDRFKAIQRRAVPGLRYPFALDPNIEDRKEVTYSKNNKTYTRVNLESQCEYVGKYSEVHLTETDEQHTYYYTYAVFEFESFFQLCLTSPFIFIISPYFLLCILRAFDIYILEHVYFVLKGRRRWQDIFGDPNISSFEKFKRLCGSQKGDCCLKLAASMINCKGLTENEEETCRTGIQNLLEEVCRTAKNGREVSGFYWSCAFAIFLTVAMVSILCCKIRPN